MATYNSVKENRTVATYKLIKDIDDLTLEEKLELISYATFYDGEYDFLNFQNNDEEFFGAYFETPLEAVRATFYGDYVYTDEYVRFNGYGNVDSFNEYSVENEIDNYIEEIVEYYIELLNKGEMNDWQGLFELVEIES